ncbi:MAG: PepSY-like domain-containing protein [Terriglobia bacterium]
MKICNKILLVICMAFVSGMLAQAAEHRVKMTDLPPAVQAAVKEQSKGATIRRLTTETENGKRLYEAEMTVNGHGKDIEIDSNGKVVEVEEVVPLASIPEAAKDAIEKSAAKGSVLKVEAVSHEGSVVAYEALVKKAGRRSEVRVDPQGNPAPESD